MISVGIAGYGYWGPKLVRNFTAMDECEVAAVCDSDAARVAGMQKRHPGIQLTADFHELLANPAVDAVAIATPVSSHYALAMAALQSGRHVLVEKSLAASPEQALRLNEEAARRGLVLMVDHTFVYNGAVRKIHDLVSAGALGEIYYYDAVRVNLGRFQHDVDVLWDLAIHDLAIMDYVFPARPCAVTATGANHVNGAAENIAYLTVFFEDSSFIAHINVNWLSPVKLRRAMIGGSRRMVVYDEMESSEKVKVYDRGITVTGGAENVYDLRVGYRAGDMHAPQLDITEPLRVMTRHFVECIRESRQPVTDGLAGLRVVEVLAAASQSMRERGRLVNLAGAGGRTAGV